MKGGRRTLVVLAVSGFLIGSVSVALSRELSATGETADYGSLSASIPGPTDPLLLGGTRVTLEQALRMVPFRIPRPQHELASDGTLTEVWVQPDTGEVGLRYSSGIRAYITTWPPRQVQDPMSFYTQQATEAGAGWATTIVGNPALVIPKDAQAPGFPPVSVVDVTIGGVEISLHADVPIEQLVDIAGTIR